MLKADGNIYAILLSILIVSCIPFHSLSCHACHTIINTNCPLLDFIDGHDQSDAFRDEGGAKNHIGPEKGLQLFRRVEESADAVVAGMEMDIDVKDQ